MARKVFLSFLGTGNYKECCYKSKGKVQSNTVKFVQEAIVDLYCSDFTSKDKAYIFLTKDAEKTHWSSLKSILETKDIEFIGIKEIPEGYSEDEIWTIFESVFNVLQEEDEIVLDVTHGFRSLPMLQIVLLNYAKSLKNIKVKNILYGAFEALGPSYNIEKRIPNSKDRIAPLLDLTSFSTIQEWTFGAESFIQTGQTKTITSLSKENIKPILIESKGQDETAKSIRMVMNSLKEIELTISTNRGKMISEEEKLSQVQKELSALIENDSSVFTPLKPILKQINNKFLPFDKKPHWEASVEWCIEHGLIQQGITQLQEGVISHVCFLNNLNSSNLEYREIVGQAFNILDREVNMADRELREEEWKYPASENRELVRTIIDSEFVKEYVVNYASLSEYRNDINHGGYLDKAVNKGDRFESKLKEHYEKYQSIRNI